MGDPTRANGADKVLVAGGTLVSPDDGVAPGDVLVRDGRIVATGALGDGVAEDVRVVDAEGLHVFPGFVDPHMHFGNYFPLADDASTETRAAAAGGVTTVFHFCKVLSHREREQSYLDLWDEVAELVGSQTHVDVGLHCAVSTRQHVKEVPGCVERGVNGFKFYMAYRGDPQSRRRGTVGIGDGLLLDGFGSIARAGGPALAMTHCENDDICTYPPASEPATEMTFADWERSRPVVAEVEAVQRAAYFASVVECPLYIVHVSSAAALHAVRESRARTGQTIIAETTPHYLAMNREACDELPRPAVAKTSPPVRAQPEVDGLWEGIRGGSIDTIGSDHCAVGEKEKGSGMKAAAAGFPSVELYSALLLTEGRRRGVPLERLAQVMCRNPARAFGKHPRKGSLRPGADADLALVDLDRAWTFRAGDAVSASKLSAYDGRELSAKVMLTMLRGRVIHDRGSFATSGGECLIA